jgi:hypothetical protein
MEKLKNGDYCKNLTKEQFDELLNIENWKGVELIYNDGIGILYQDECLIHNHSFFNLKTKLSFEDFKNRAINTFKK